jgi:excinuclease ABC subunit A
MSKRSKDYVLPLQSTKKRLQILCDVGLDYIALGQSSKTLSGGEAQRIKLVNELAKRGKNSLYVLDEPTTGLHCCDVEKLICVLNRLVDRGNSVWVIEHNLDVLKSADYIVDVGPDGGGKIVVRGTPEKVTRCKKSHTGRYLKPLLQ